MLFKANPTNIQGIKLFLHITISAAGVASSILSLVALRDGRKIKLEKFADDEGFFTVHTFGVETIGLHHGTVVVLMSLAEFYRHGQVVV